MLTVKIKDKNRFFKDFFKKHRELTRKEVEVLVKRAVRELEINTPVDTGLAKQSWSYRFDSLESFFKRSGVKFEVLNKQDYILFVNNGTSQIAPRRFIEQVLLRYGVQIGPLAQLK